jgi:LSD1 subclass zinc finger protein
MENWGVKIQSPVELDVIMKDALIYNGFVPRNLNRYQPGDSIVHCSNCQVLTDGALSLSDLPIEFWQKHFPQYLPRINNLTILNHQQNSE